MKKSICLILILGVGWKISVNKLGIFIRFKVRKYHMKQLLSICYIVFMAAISVSSFKNDLKIAGYPLWMLIFSIITIVPGLISMFLWAFEFEPKKKWLWKMVPFALVVYYVADWYFDFVVYRKSDMTNQVIVGITLLGLLVLYPLLYSTFELGFRGQE